MYANSTNGLECSHISIFTGIGCSYHYKFILSWSNTMPLRFFSTTDSWSVFQHRLQRTAPWITARPLPWLSSAFCVLAPDLQFHLNEEVLLFFNQALWWAGGRRKGSIERLIYALSISHFLLRFPISPTHFLPSYFYQDNLLYFCLSFLNLLSLLFPLISVPLSLITFQ